MFSINAPKDRPLCIYGVVRPLYIAARLFGFFPFSVKIDSSGKIRTYFTLIDLFIFVVQVMIYSCLTYIHLDRNFIENSATSALLALGMRIGLICGLMNSVAFLFADLYNRYEISALFNMCQDFDSMVR